MLKEQPLKKIRENFVLILFIGSFVVGWTLVQARLSSLEVLAKENKTVLECIHEINISIATIKKDIEFIRLQLNK